jgi:Tfp pilus assembly protein PilF
MTTRAATLVQTAIGFHRSGNLAAAQTAYVQALAVDPDNVDALHLFGALLSDQGDPKGLDLMARAVALRPDLAAAHQNLGNAYIRFERLADAERHFRRAAALQPNDADASNNLGGALLRREQYTEAEACVARALQRCLITTASSPANRTMPIPATSARGCCYPSAASPRAGSN